MAKKSRRLKLTDQVRKAVNDCGQSRYRVCVETGLDAATMSRFMSGERGLSMEALDAIGDYLALSITSGRKPASKPPANRKGK